LQQADEYKDEALQLQNSSQLNVLQTLYETDRKESEIRLLREQNAMNRTNQRMLGVSAAALLVLFLIAIVLNTRKKRVDKKIQEMRENHLLDTLERKSIEAEKLGKELKLKTAALTRYSLNLSHKNKLLTDLARSLDHIVARDHLDHSSKLRSMVQEIDHSLSQDNEWDEFMNIFEEIYPEFTKKLNDLAIESLSPSELRLGMLLRMNLSSKEIASILRVTPDSVRVARHRLRKKLPIDQKKELVNFMVEL
jgi:DNA-binding CsgD family transcriptional regulator